jgi:sialic acid synthase SpsE
MFLSTPFDIPSVRVLVHELGVGRLKIPSGEITNVPLLRAAAGEGVPLIVSTGMCDLDDVAQAIGTITDVWAAAGTAPGLSLMHCTSAYPTPMDEAHLRSMQTLATTFGLPVGFSDHTEGIVAALVAVGLGATLIEKHFTIDRTMPGPDHQASADPATLTALIAAIRQAEQALGSAEKAPRGIEIATRALVRRSLVATRDIAAGTTIRAEDLIALRPDDGISARDIDRVVGRAAWRAFSRGEVLTWPE